jgi:hypothetical protein
MLLAPESRADNDEVTLTRINGLMAEPRKAASVRSRRKKPLPGR